MSDAPFWETRAIYVIRSGSHAYGTNTPASDEDTRGVCIPPAEYLIGLKEWDHYHSDQPDITVYSLHKAAQLALRCNPSIIEMLHVRECDILHITEAGQSLRRNAHLFLSKRAADSFGRYALKQLRLLSRGRTARHGSHVGLVEQHGYDTKNAMHLIRLLRTGIELLRTGEANTYRPDREELLDIRRGAWSLERVLAEAARLETDLQAAHDASTLPEEPDFEAVNMLAVDITRRALEGHL